MIPDENKDFSRFYIDSINDIYSYKENFIKVTLINPLHCRNTVERVFVTIFLGHLKGHIYLLNKQIKQPFLLFTFISFMNSYTLLIHLSHTENLSVFKLINSLNCIFLHFVLLDAYLVALL